MVLLDAAASDCDDGEGGVDVGATPVPDSQPSPRDVDAAGDGCGDEGDRCCCSRAEGTDPGVAGGDGGAEGGSGDHRGRGRGPRGGSIASPFERATDDAAKRRGDGRSVEPGCTPRVASIHLPSMPALCSLAFLADKVYVHIYSHRHRAGSENLKLVKKPIPHITATCGKRKSARVRTDLSEGRRRRAPRRAAQRKNVGEVEGHGRDRGAGFGVGRRRHQRARRRREHRSAPCLQGWTLRRLHEVREAAGPPSSCPHAVDVLSPFLPSYL